MKENINMKYLNHTEEDHKLLNLLNELVKMIEQNSQDYDFSNTIRVMMLKPEFDISKDILNRVEKNQYLLKSLLDIVSECNTSSNVTLNILELNRNSNHILGDYVVDILSLKNFMNRPIEYTIATNRKLARIKTYDNCYKLIDWEADETEPFPNNIYDIDMIIFKDDISIWSMNTEINLFYSYDCLVDRGFLLSIFRCELTEAEISLNRIIGETVPNSEEFQKRIVDYSRIASNIGFTLIANKSDSIGTILLFRKILIPLQIPMKDEIIEFGQKINVWFDLVKQKLLDNHNKRSAKTIWLIANASQINGILGFINCLRLETGGELFKCIFNCGDDRVDIDWTVQPFSDILANDLPINVIKDGRLGTYRHLRLNTGFDKKLSKNYYYNGSDIKNMKWFDLTHYVPDKLKPIKCEIYYSALNFKDIVIATGKLIEFL